MRYRSRILMLGLAAVGLVAHGTTAALDARPADPCATPSRSAGSDPAGSADSPGTRLSHGGHACGRCCSGSARRTSGPA